MMMMMMMMVVMILLIATVFELARIVNTKTDYLRKRANITCVKNN